MRCFQKTRLPRRYQKIDRQRGRSKGWVAGLKETRALRNHDDALEETSEVEVLAHRHTFLWQEPKKSHPYCEVLPAALKVSSMRRKSHQFLQESHAGPICLIAESSKNLARF